MDNIFGIMSMIFLSIGMIPTAGIYWIITLLTDIVYDPNLGIAMLVIQFSGLILGATLGFVDLRLRR